MIWEALEKERPLLADCFPSALTRATSDRERQFDELFVLVDCVQGTAHVVRDFGSALLLDPVGQFKDGGLKGQLVFVDLEEQGREQVSIWHRNILREEDGVAPCYMKDSLTVGRTRERVFGGLVMEHFQNSYGTHCVAARATQTPETTKP